MIRNNFLTTLKLWNENQVCGSRLLFIRDPTKISWEPSKDETNIFIVPSPGKLLPACNQHLSENHEFWSVCGLSVFTP